MATAEEIIGRLETVATWHKARQRKVIDDIIADLKELHGVASVTDHQVDSSIATSPEVLDPPVPPPLPNSAF
jgi:hypothetical protein